MIDNIQLSQLVEKVNIKCHEEIQDNIAVQTVVELCAISDGVAVCDRLSYNDVYKLINIISLE